MSQISGSLLAKPFVTSNLHLNLDSSLIVLKGVVPEAKTLALIIKIFGRLAVNDYVNDWSQA